MANRYASSQPRVNAPSPCAERAVPSREWHAGYSIDTVAAVVPCHRKTSGEQPISRFAAFAPPLPGWPADTLVPRMRARTAALHRQAEQSGVVADLLAGRISRTAYALYLRNLLPAYQAMEQCLRQQAERPLFNGLAHPALFRAAALTADLAALAGPDWAGTLPLLPAGHRYMERVAWAGSGDGARLLAHCYTRYLGDLSGGQLLGLRVANLFGGRIPAMSFTRFAGVGDLRGFADRFRSALDHAGGLLADPAAVIEEAAVAFQKNIDLSNEVSALPNEVSALRGSGPSVNDG